MTSSRIMLTQEPEGGYTVIVPSLSGCITYGQNIDHAMDMAKEAIEGYLEVLKEQGAEIPDGCHQFYYSFFPTSRSITSVILARSYS